MHAARKVVGVGSVGTRAWVVLMLGRDDADPLDPAAQGGAGVGARAVPRRERVREPRPARRRGPAADAGGERHPARLGPVHRAGRREPRLLHASAVGRQGVGPGRARWTRRSWGSTPSSAARRSPRRTPAPGTPSRSPATSGAATASIAPWRRSPEPTPTRTSATTTPCSAAVASGTRRASQTDLRQAWSGRLRS